MSKGFNAKHGYQSIYMPVVCLWISISTNRVEKLNDIRHTHAATSLVLVAGIFHVFFCFRFLFSFSIFCTQRTHACSFFPVESSITWVCVKEERSGSESECMHTTRECYQSIVFSFSCSCFNRENNKHKFAIIQTLRSSRYGRDKKDRIFSLQFNRTRPLTPTKNYFCNRLKMIGGKKILFRKQTNRQTNEMR